MKSSKVENHNTHISFDVFKKTNEERILLKEAKRRHKQKPMRVVDDWVDLKKK